MSTKRWLGNANAIADVWTISLSGTVTSQTYTVTINAKTIQFVSGVSDTVNTVLTGLQAAWSSISPSPPVEFTELTALGLPVGGPFTTLQLTGNTLGKPSTITVSNGGGASTFSIAHTTSATGPNDFTNGANWSGGSAPANSDTLVFDNGSIPCKYNLGSSLTGVTVSIEPAYSGQIGLPFINSDNTTTYAEYRTTSLTLAGGTVLVNSTGISRCNLAFGANTATVRVLNTGSRPDPNTPVVLIIGGNGSSELDITKGDVGLSFYQGTTATVPTIKTGFANNALSDVSLIIGVGATLTTITKSGGYLSTRSTITTLNQDVGAGTVDLLDSVGVTTVNQYAGTVNYSTNGTIGTINAYAKAIVNFDADPRAITLTNPINIYSSGVTVNDSQKRVNSGTLSIAMNGASSVVYNHGANNTLVLT